MPTAFLTGGTGFLGGHVARALLAEGWTLRALARERPRRRDALSDLAVQRISGDLTRSADLARAAAGCDAIVHAAGIVKARRLENYRDVNARGTQRLVEAARETAANALFVYISSQAAAGPARNGRPVAEGDPARPVSWYGISKREGEEAVERGWKGPWIALRPGVLYGPGDTGLLAYFRMAASGWLPVPAGASRIQIGSAEQAALAITRAASRRDLAGRAGFVCDPAPIALGALAAEIARLPPRAARLVPVPDALVRLAGLAETLRESATRRSRPFNADKAKEILAGDWLCDSSPMRSDLALPPPISLADGLRATWDWYREAGWVHPRRRKRV